MASAIERVELDLHEKRFDDATVALGDLATRHEVNFDDPQQMRLQDISEQLPDTVPQFIETDIATNSTEAEDEPITADQLGNAFDSLWPATYGLARRMLSDSARAEEIAQESFFFALRSLGNGTVIQSKALKSWMMTTTANLAKSELRRRRLIRMGSLALPVGETDVTYEERLADPSAGHFDRHIANHDLIRQGIATLKPDQQQKLLLKDWDGYDIRTLAKHFRMTPDAFKMELSRIRRVVRANLQAAGIYGTWEE